jgi:lipoprotein-anchoring transpeptidase ErfK/SrfK
MFRNLSGSLGGMRRLLLVAAGIAAFFVGAPASVGSASAATLVARVDLSQQTMVVFANGRPIYTWAVSTGRAGFRTPTGSWHPVRLERDWHSRKYEWAPMPNSVFFYRGYAVHGTTDIANLGRTASHGCVRLAPRNAGIFFDLVLAHGRANTLIQIVR